MVTKASAATHPAPPSTGQAVQPSPRGAPAPYIVLVGLDLSEPGGRAWRFAFDLAALKGEDSEVHAVVLGTRALAPRVRDWPTPYSSASPGLEPHRPMPLLKVLEHRSGGGTPRLMAMHFRTGRPDRAIVQLARDIHADVIVVATEPTTGWQRMLGGSTADRIARVAPCPVVVVRPKTHDEDPGVAEYGARGLVPGRNS